MMSMKVLYGYAQTLSSLSKGTMWGSVVCPQVLNKCLSPKYMGICVGTHFCVISKVLLYTAAQVQEKGKMMQNYNYV